MGKKVSVMAFRNGVFGWNDLVSWFNVGKQFPTCLHEDYLIRNFFKTNCSVNFSRTKIERIRKKIQITLFFQKPCFMLFKDKKKITDIKELRTTDFRNNIDENIVHEPEEKVVSKKKIKEQKVPLIKENIPFFKKKLQEYLMKNPITQRGVGQKFFITSVPEFDINFSDANEMDAQIICNNIVDKMANRLDYKRYIRSIVKYANKNGVSGIFIKVSGRLKGAAIARSEVFKQGKMPLQTLRKKIISAQGAAKTKYGICGVKVQLFFEENITIMSGGIR